MIRATFPVTLAAAALVLGGCEHLGTTPGEPLGDLPRALSAGEQQIIGSSNGFAFHLLDAVNAGRESENLFLSPLSVSMALGMTMNGAATETYEEMRSTLRFGSLSQEAINESYRSLTELLLGLDREVEIGVANSVWYRQEFPFHDTFLRTVERQFGARVEGLDFGDPRSVSTINDWVDRSTEGKIDSILDEIKDEDVMYLINAIYFKGSWARRFDAERTRPAPFTTLDGRQVQVEMMNLNDTFDYAGTAEYTAVDLPYGNGAFTMTVVLPAPGQDVNDFMSSLDGERWGEILASLAPREIDVALPRFRLENDLTLNEALQAMGMPTAFIPDGADFTRMSPRGRQLHISEVRHRTMVEVDEEGTEAAAATAVTIILESQSPGLRADRPFFFAIRERFSGTILFAGKMVDPTVEGP